MQDDCTAQLADVMTYLEGKLPADTFTAVQRAVQLAREQAWARIMADGTRHRNVVTTRHKRLLHVKHRLRTRFGQHLSLEEVRALADSWASLPPIRINRATILRRVMFRNREIHAVYDLSGSGAQELCTVLDTAENEQGTGRD